MHFPRRNPLEQHPRREAFSPAHYMQLMRRRRLGAGTPMEADPAGWVQPSPLSSAGKLLRHLAGRRP